MGKIFNMIKFDLRAYWGHKTADFEFLAYISFIVTFIASECITRYWETICGGSK